MWYAGLEHCTAFLCLLVFVHFVGDASGSPVLEDQTNCSRILENLVPENDRLTNDREMICLHAYGKCYMKFRENYTHDEAEEECKRYGAVIVRPESDEESAALAKLVQNDFHLTGKRETEDDRYDFPDDMPVYANWICFRDTYRGLCLAASTKKAFWRPIDCFKRISTICQF
ncbi:hypothetical protein FBUS_09614 [Fasciolopsis buskii]|uniref:C-type lectin domain-containing protein n=1 Tax=Fasciolopsis buskii TaxID=27845 RepID=A0A8E0VJM2_9TREM|nr:hypothetical protein FBUS_09614 [Fasciolopsis buski]